MKNLSTQPPVSYTLHWGLRRNGTVMLSSSINVPLRLRPHIQLFDCSTDYSGADMERLFLRTGKNRRKGRHYACPTDKMGKRDGYVGYPSYFRDGGANGKDGTLIVEDNIDNACQSASDPIIGGPFAFDDGVGGPAHIMVNFLSMIGIKLNTAQPAEIFQRRPTNGHQRPGQYFRIAMFTQHIAMNVLRVYPEMATQKGTKTGRIKHGAGAEYSACRNSILLRVVRRQMGHHIYRIGGNDQYGIRCIGENFRHNIVEHCGIAFQELQSALTRLLVDAGSYYYGAAPLQVGITAGGHLQRSGKGNGV